MSLNFQLRFILVPSPGSLGGWKWDMAKEGHQDAVIHSQPKGSLGWRNELGWPLLSSWSLPERERLGQGRKGESQNGRVPTAYRVYWIQRPQNMALSIGLEVLKHKIQLSKFEDPIGCVQWFMHRAAACLPSRQELWRAVQNEKFLRQKGADKEVSKKKWIVSGKVMFLWGKARVYHSDWPHYCWPGNSRLTS